MYVCMYVCIFRYRHVQMYECMYIYKYMYMYVHMYKNNLYIRPPARKFPPHSPCGLGGGVPNNNSPTSSVFVQL